MPSAAWIIAFAVVLHATCGVSGEDRRLAQFLQLGAGSRTDGDPGEHVSRMRDVMFRRVRCGAQQGMAAKLCRDCLSTQRILNMSRGSNAVRRNETGLQELARASVVLLNYLLTFQSSCTPESVRRGYVGSCRLYDECQSEMHGRLSAMKNDTPSENLEALENILREAKTVFEPDPSKQCFSAEIVLNELNARSKEFQTLPRDVATVLLITGHLFSGECIDVGESVADFLDDIFLHYGDGCERVMSQSGFTKLWNDLQMQRKGKHVDHGVQKNACVSLNTDSRQLEYTEKYIPLEATDVLATEAAFGTVTSSGDGTSAIQNKSGAPVWTPINRAPVSVPDAENTTVMVSLLEGPTSGSRENATAEENSRRRTDLYLVDGEKGDKEVDRVVEVVTAHAPVSSRRVRHTVYPEDHEHKNLANECLPSDDLLQRFLTPGDKVITSTAFLQLCPALIQQAVSGVCNSRLKAAHLDAPKANGSREVLQQAAATGANPWYAVASVTAITAASLLGLGLLPVLKKSFFVLINAFFTGLAFGTMSGDVVLHIMPQYLGLHKHDEHGHDHDSESTLNRLFPSHLQRQLAFLSTMYLLFIVECIFSAFMGEKRDHHGHSHAPVDVPMRDLTVVTDLAGGDREPKPSRCSRITDFLKPSNLLTGISSKAVVIILADTVHNFADGMAIAVGFSTSYKDGFSTSVAVLFHELPHEIGDFAVLMNSGLGYWKAFVFNLLSGLSAFLGLGVGVFTASIFREWLLCITAGLFFFVVMAELLPDMRLESKEKWKEFAAKILGTVLGTFAMICIAMYELSAA